MKNPFILLLLIGNFAFSQISTTNYYFIRHAEKVDQSENPDLSEIGKKRAENWCRVLSEIKFDFIYSTNFKRTLQTVLPISLDKKIIPIIYDPKTIDIETFLKETKFKTVLIVGHSNSTPDFVNKILAEKKYSKIEETIFENLYILSIHSDGSKHVQLLKID